jgi:hypothetical protein
MEIELLVSKNIDSTRCKAQIWLAEQVSIMLKLLKLHMRRYPVHMKTQTLQLTCSDYLEN